MYDQTLLMLANEVRGKTLRLLGDVDETRARYTGPGGLKNSILWHAGHALVVVEKLSVFPLVERDPAFPPGYIEAFAPRGDPSTVTSWPSLAEVTALLQDQLGRLTDAIRITKMERMDQVIDAERNRTLRYSVLHGLHDEAGHQGEIYLLKKLAARAV
ncbi:MAG TPA: DinB family protein [Humisphaera sp.]